MRNTNTLQQEQRKTLMVSAPIPNLIAKMAIP